jgi:hypothetical protein
LGLEVKSKKCVSISSGSTKGLSSELKKASMAGRRRFEADFAFRDYRFFLSGGKSGIIVGPSNTSDSIPRHVTVALNMETEKVRRIHMKTGRFDPQKTGGSCQTRYGRVLHAGSRRMPHGWEGLKRNPSDARGARV